ncbi:Fis family transcriptional regulator [Tardiphaga alba]|uniref:Fis family transcriptional regulator n=1 Tax=Tardiphaga alba TaxID=340268 RepID=A0ABX8A5E3_9BRAD|nr:helix-turn-helix domain-containing protein [Tardiphaga alba]QUS38941.1 Fis family transcriptional regulator [Tardiphaga alba]
MSQSFTSDDYSAQDGADAYSDDIPDAAFEADALVPASEPSDVVPMLVGATVEAVERELMLQTLARCDGNRTHAARVLGVSVRTMRNKIKQYSADGIEVPASG